MKPSKHLLLATIAALGVALAFANDPAMAEDLAAKKTADETKHKGHGKWTEIESMSSPNFGSAQPKTGGQNQMKMKNSAQQGAVVAPPGTAAGADGTVDGRDYLLWRKNLSQQPQPAGGALPTGPTDLGAKQDPKEIHLLVPAVQKVREAAGPQKNAGGATAAQQTGASTPRSYDTKEKKK